MTPQPLRGAAPTAGHHGTDLPIDGGRSLR